jgi:CheY-like chemotaxis protein
MPALSCSFRPAHGPSVRIRDEEAGITAGIVRAAPAGMHLAHLWPFSRPRDSHSRHHLTVLVADSDPYVRASLESLLSRRGCRAFFASDGTGALRCLAMSRDPSRSVGRIDLVIADADLPGRSGIDLMMMARANDWEVEVVLTSHLLRADLGVELVRLGARAVLKKPLALPEIDRALVRVAEARASR